MMIPRHHDESWISDIQVVQLTEIGIRRKKSSRFENKDNDLLIEKLIWGIWQDKSMKISRQISSNE